MELQFGVLLILVLVVASSGQESCTCATNKWTVCTQDVSGICNCTLVGSNHRVNCSTLTSKCLLMKAEMIPRKGKRFHGPRNGFVDNDGIYNPDCEDSGIFKARQCNQTDTCWCVNTAGIRRTEKGDKSLKCSELVRTSWIYIELKHKKPSSTFEDLEVANALKHLFQNRYKLHPKYVADVKYDSPFIQIRLSQNDFEKSDNDVDIADVAYYFEKDIKDNSLFHSNNTLNVSVNGAALDIEKILIYYVDEKPPEFSASRMIAGVSAVVTVVTLTIVFGVSALVILRWRRTRKYKKVEIKEMGEMRRPTLQLP
uniref:Tumor associated calcium signal transducer 2 n=1 Tax=Apteryx owenii TaxID=8824 RepID=A0A8B9P5C0_APTOW